MEKIDQMKDVLDLIGLRHDDPQVICRFNPKKEIDHISIHKDLLNKVSKELIALKHKQPLCVIDAIENQTYDPKKGYVENKIYSLSEFICIINGINKFPLKLSTTFKSANKDIIKNSFNISKIKDYGKNIVDKYILPIKDEDENSKSHSFLVNGVEYMSMKKVAELFNEDTKSARLLMLSTQGYLIPNIPIEIKIITGLKQYKKEDVLRSKDILDFYIPKKDIDVLNEMEPKEALRVYRLISEKHNINLISLNMNSSIDKRLIKDIYALKDIFKDFDTLKYMKNISLLEEYLKEKKWIKFYTYEALTTYKSSLSYKNEIKKNKIHGYLVQDFKDKYNKPPFKDGMVNKDFLIEILKHKLSKL